MKIQDPKLAAATEKSLLLQNYAEQLEARLMPLETLIGVPTSAEVAKVLNDPALQVPGADADVTAQISGVNKKSQALESLAAKLESRIVMLEEKLKSPVGTMPQAPAPAKRELAPVLAGAVSAPPPAVSARTATSTSSGGCWDFITKVASCCSDDDREIHRELPPEVHAEHMSADAFTDKRIRATVLPVLMGMQQLSHRLELLEHPLGELGAAAKAPHPTIEIFHEDGRPHGIVERPKFGLPSGVNIDEVVQRERLQAEAILSEHKQAHAEEMSQLRAELTRASMLTQEQESRYAVHAESVKGYEVQLQESLQSIALHQQQLLGHEQTIAELEAKLEAQTREVQQHAAASQAYQTEALSHKQRLQEHEEGVVRLSSENALLQQTIQEHQESIGFQSAKHEEEKKQFLEQIEILQGKLVVYEVQAAQPVSPPQPVVAEQVPVVTPAVSAPILVEPVSPLPVVEVASSPALVTEVVSPTPALVTEVVSPLPAVTEVVSPARVVSEVLSPTPVASMAPAPVTAMPVKMATETVSSAAPLRYATAAGGVYSLQTPSLANVPRSATAKAASIKMPAGVAAKAPAYTAGAYTYGGTPTAPVIQSVTPTSSYQVSATISDGRHRNVAYAAATAPAASAAIYGRP